jgi:hypothetical protein
MSLELVTLESVNSGSHKYFDAAQKALKTGDAGRARSFLHSIATMSGIESRYQVEAWYLLRLLGGVPPEDVAKLVLGVIVEVGIETGCDLLAAYQDRTAYYANHAGGGVVWRGRGDSLALLIGDVLKEAAAIVDEIGPWKRQRRLPPARGQMRLSILSPSGIHFGEGPFDELERDARAKRLVHASTDLMARLTTMAFGREDLFRSN